MPQQRVFAIKEPYYKASADGGYTIRVDHPSDAVCLNMDSLLIPHELASRVVEINVAPRTWKNDGNCQYRAKNYLKALEKYTSGFEACSDQDGIVLADLYRNRSMAQLLMGHYEPAARDAYSSLVQGLHGVDQKKAKSYDTKALFRAGRVNYELGRFEDAKRDFTNALQMTPMDHDASGELTRVMHRLTEAADGKYDFCGARQSHKRKNVRLDHSSFTCNVAVRSADQRGRGLFAVKSINAGDIILCEKAFEISLLGDHDNAVYTLVNINTNRVQMGSQASLLFRIIDKLRYNPKLAQSFLALYARGYKPRCNVHQVDGMNVVDTFEVQHIIEKNSFGVSSTNSSDSDGYGIWITASYINHSFIGNAQRDFLGDIMVIRATCDIKRDEEITMPYRSWDADPVNGIELIQKTWEFTCDCVLCLAEKKTACATKRERLALWQKTDKLLNAHKPSKDHKLPSKIVREVETLYSKLSITYADTTYKGLPRLALIAPSHWNCAAQAGLMNPQQCIQNTLQVLSAHGFDVQLERDSVNIVRTHAILGLPAIHAAVNLADVYGQLGQIKISQAFGNFARDSWKIMQAHAELHEFEKLFGR
nr:rna polymerase ii-associated protein 3 [Quercus suber]